jgi:chromosome segregation ATPase
MKPHRISLRLFVALVLLSPARAAEPVDAASARLRESVRSLTLQLRDTQAQVATLQAEKQTAKTESDQIVAALKKQVEAQDKKIADERTKADKATAEAKTAAQAQATEIARLKAELAKTTVAFQQADTLAKATEAERAKLAAQNAVLERLIADREAKNLALYTLGNEILVRYEKFSLGEALAAKEPFVGTARVKLENLVQDYADKLRDSKAKP